MNKRSLEAIAAVAEKWPEWNPLLHFAAVANDETLDPVIRLDAARAAAIYMLPRPKPVEMEPDALVELERRLLRAKIEAAATTITQPGLAERLQRAHSRFQILVDTGVTRAPDDLFDVTPCALSAAPEATFAPAAGPVPEVPNAYRPVLPRVATPASGPAASTDWATPVAQWSNRNEGRAQVEYDPTSGSYDLP